VLDAPEVGRTLKALSDSAKGGGAVAKDPDSRGYESRHNWGVPGSRPSSTRPAVSKLVACVPISRRPPGMLLLSRPDTFTEGFDTADLKEAEALLDELAEPPIAARG
jgi:hypothetical protein